MLVLNCYINKGDTRKGSIDNFKQNRRNNPRPYESVGSPSEIDSIASNDNSSTRGGFHKDHDVNPKPNNSNSGMPTGKKYSNFHQNRSVCPHPVSQSVQRQIYPPQYYPRSPELQFNHQYQYAQPNIQRYPGQQYKFTQQRYYQQHYPYTYPTKKSYRPVGTQLPTENPVTVKQTPVQGNIAQGTHLNQRNKSRQPSRQQRDKDGNIKAALTRLSPELNERLSNINPTNPVISLFSKFFIIKSYSEDDVHRSIKYSIWASTDNGNKKLDAGFAEANAVKGTVYLLYSVNGR